AALAGDNSALLAWQARSLGDQPRLENLNCYSNPANLLDFTLLDPDSRIISSQIRRMVVTSSVSVKTFDEVLDATKIIGYRHCKDSSKPYPIDEQVALVNRGTRLISSIDETIREGYVEQLRKLSNTWCSRGASLLLFLFGDEATRRQIEREFVDQVL